MKRLDKNDECKIRRYSDWLKKEHGNYETDGYWTCLAKETVLWCKNNDVFAYSEI